MLNRNLIADKETDCNHLMAQEDSPKATHSGWRTREDPAQVDNRIYVRIVYVPPKMKANGNLPTKRKASLSTLHVDCAPFFFFKSSKRLGGILSVCPSVDHNGALCFVRCSMIVVIQRVLPVSTL